MGANYTVAPGDIVNTKVALSLLGYYNVPPHRGIDAWTDDAMFDGIRTFQKSNGPQGRRLHAPWRTNGTGAQCQSGGGRKQSWLRRG